jgi:hypothetical protein
MKQRERHTDLGSVCLHHIKLKSEFSGRWYLASGTHLEPAETTNPANPERERFPGIAAESLRRQGLNTIHPSVRTAGGSGSGLVAHRRDG